MVGIVYCILYEIKHNSVKEMAVCYFVFIFVWESFVTKLSTNWSISLQDWYGIHYEYDWQRKRTKYTVPQVDKGTSLHCYYVKMCRTGEYACGTCSTHFYIIAVKGCSFVYLRNCIFCPLSLSVMFIVIVQPRWYTVWICNIIPNEVTKYHCLLCFKMILYWGKKIHNAKI